ncbi:MAG: peptide deformylase [Alphaproteobacteria bacterium]|nr:peptide deformylase [Alphaproteobacteria bacterium]OJV45428.1 MAG: peptide deformylase [Alphaproteobacteria bacterium 43-37]
MALLDIIIAPDPRLKIVCQPVDKVDVSVRQLMQDMVETMYHNQGAGLAAPQVGVHKRIIVMDVSPNDREDIPNLRIMANPEIFWRSDEVDRYTEGCLSIPELGVSVTRSSRVKCRYIDENNVSKEVEASGYWAKCIQHEIDHLDGILTFDYQSPLKKSMIIRKLNKIKKQIDTLPSNA